MDDKFQKLAVPGAILFAGALIAGVIMYGDKNVSPQPAKVGQAAGDQAAAPAAPASDAYKKVSPITDKDHILGSKDAKVKIVNYSDMECPFCVSFDVSMKSVVAKYNGDVAWVYRHYPLGFHEYAMPAADASECAAEIAGNDAFWKFLDGMIAFDTNAKQGDKPDMTKLAAAAGVDSTAFGKCFGKDKYKDLIAGDMANAEASGLQGTPFSVIIIDGTPVDSIDGALPIDQITAKIDKALGK